MSEHTCRAQDLTCVSTTPFQSHHECRTTLPLELVLNNRFFGNVRDNLRAGDQIAICQYDKQPGAHNDTALTGFAVVRVIGKSQTEVKLLLIQGPIAVGSDAVAIPPPAPEPRAEYIKGSGEVRWNPGRKCYELRVDGKVLLTDIPREDKEHALAIARGDAPLPEMNKAA